MILFFRTKSQSETIRSIPSIGWVSSFYILYWRLNLPYGEERNWNCELHVCLIVAMYILLEITVKNKLWKGLYMQCKYIVELSMWLESCSLCWWYYRVVCDLMSLFGSWYTLHGKYVICDTIIIFRCIICLGRGDGIRVASDF